MPDDPDLPIGGDELPVSGDALPGDASDSEAGAMADTGIWPDPAEESGTASGTSATTESAATAGATAGAAGSAGGAPRHRRGAVAGSGEARQSWRARRRAKKARRSKLRRRLTRTGIALLLLLLAFIGSIVGYVVYLVNQINVVTVKHLTHPTGGIEDILLVGSTSRCAVTNGKHLGNFVQQCVDGVNGVNSDVVMILRLNSRTRRISLLSLPRDTFVPDARAGDLSNKIDAALADGPSQLVLAIEEDFGIPINHFVVLNFQSFAGIVTALGGISMYFPTTVKDVQSGLYVNHTGCIHISGLEALALVRARHMQYHYLPRQGIWLGYDGSGDLGRIERDHIFLRVLASDVAKRGLGSPTTDLSLLDAVAPQLTVDGTFGIGEMESLLETFHSVNFGTAPQLTLPIVIDSQTYSYKGYNYGDIVLPTEPQDSAAIAAFMGFKPAGLALSPASINVSVVDGTGSPSATATTASQLSSLGYHVVGTAAQPSVGPISETTVVYNGKANLAAAQRVLSSLSGTVVLGQGVPADGAKVGIVTGSDLSVASPPVVPPSTSTPSGKSTTTTVPRVSTTTIPPTTVSPSPSSSALGPPTASSEKIPPYDPRACPTSP